MAKLPSGPDVRVALPPKPANDGTVAYATAARAYDANVLLRQQVIANLLTFFAVYTFPLGLLGLNVFLGFLPEDWGDNLSPAVGDAIESIMMIHLNLVGPFAIIILLIDRKSVV